MVARLTTDAAQDALATPCHPGLHLGLHLGLHPGPYLGLHPGLHPGLHLGPYLGLSRRLSSRNWRVAPACRRRTGLTLRLATG